MTLVHPQLLQDGSGRRCKLAAISMVRNECDIIELFLKLNSRAFDAIFVIDHGSTDNTASIVQKVAASGYPVSYTLWQDPAFRQAQIMTVMVRQVAQSNRFDYIVPMDADEFLVSAHPGLSVSDAISSQISTSQAGHVPWRTYVPIDANYFECHAPLYEIFRMQAVEPQTPFRHKVVIGNEIAKNCHVLEGNHSVLLNQQLQSWPNLSLHMQHAPLRCPQQAMRKAILGSHTLALKAGRHPEEGAHWDFMAEKIRARGFVVDASLLRHLAFRYGLSSDEPVVEQVDETAPRIGCERDRIEFLELAVPNVLHSLDSYIGELVRTIKSSTQAGS